MGERSGPPEHETHAVIYDSRVRPSPCTPSELKARLEEMQDQLAQRRQQAEAQAATIAELEAGTARLEDLAAERAAEAQSLALQLEAAQEGLAAAKQQVG